MNVATIKLPPKTSRKSALEEEFWLQILAHKVGVPEREYVFAPPRKWRFDFAYPELSIGIEVEGGGFVAGRHGRGVGMEADCEKYAVALLDGWRVLRVTGRQVKDGSAISWLKELLNRETRARVATQRLTKGVHL